MPVAGATPPNWFPESFGGEDPIPLDAIVFRIPRELPENRRE
jgi:hypothetical protein